MKDSYRVCYYQTYQPRNYDDEKEYKREVGLVQRSVDLLITIKYRSCSSDYEESEDDDGTDTDTGSYFEMWKQPANSGL